MGKQNITVGACKTKRSNSVVKVPDAEMLAEGYSKATVVSRDAEAPCDFTIFLERGRELEVMALADDVPCMSAMRRDSHTASFAAVQ